jgi:serine/threonine protein kinase
MPSPPTHLHAGLPIGGYELVYPLGQGGMAEVWLARRQGSLASRHVAIKLIADHHVGDPAYRRMFRVEAELSGLLTHANIVQVFQEGEEHGRSFLVMEWVDGVSLVRVRSALTVLGDDQRHRITAYIVGQLLHALAYAHNVTTADGRSLGIVHRDVSPQNVLVSNQGEVKLTDFGVAHHVLEESSGLHVKGKLRYMAPEQLASSARAPTVDLYAVGAILHELLDGEPFRAEARDEPHMLGLVLRGVMPTLSREIPHELDALREGLLEPSPEQRLQSADAALEVLARYPGYRDARRELMQVCRALTGVAKPRSGPAEVTTPEAAPLVRAPHARASGVPIAVDAHAQGPNPVPTEQLSAPPPMVDSVAVAQVASSTAPRSALVPSARKQAPPEHVDVDGTTARVDASSVPRASSTGLNEASSLAAPASESQAEITEVAALTSMGVTAVAAARGGFAPAAVQPRPVLPGMVVASVALFVLGGGSAVGVMMAREQRRAGPPEGTDADEAGRVSASSVDEPTHQGEPRARTIPGAETNPSPGAGSGSGSSRHASETTTERLALSSITNEPEATATTSVEEDPSENPPKPLPAYTSSEAPPPPAMHSTPACISARKRAQSAATEWQWAAVIEATKRKDCWPRTVREQWRGLRIKALAEEERFEECAKLGREDSDEAIRRQGRVCQERVKR